MLNKEIELFIPVLFFHGKTTDDYRYTIAGTIKDDNLILGIALCSGNDQFSKIKGRNIATGRLLNQRKNIRGRIIKSLYSIKNSFAEEWSGFSENYFIGNELKVFIEEVVKLNSLTKKELINHFNLKH